MSRSPVRIAITCDTQRLGCKLLVNLLKINGAEPVVIPTLLEAEDGFFKFNTTCEELKKRHLEQIGFSKYSTAIALMENVKSNNFKPNFIKLKKLEEKYGRN